MNQHDDPRLDKAVAALDRTLPRHRTKVEGLAARVVSTFRAWLPAFDQKSVGQHNKDVAGRTKEALTKTEKLIEDLETVMRERPIECGGGIFTPNTEQAREELLRDADAAGVASEVQAGLMPDRALFTLIGLRQKLWELHEHDEASKPRSRPRDPAGSLWIALEEQIETEHEREGVPIGKSDMKRIIAELFADVLGITDPPTENTLRTRRDELSQFHADRPKRLTRLAELTRKKGG